MENECKALPGVAYPGVRDNRSTVNTKTGYDDDDDELELEYYLSSCNCYDIFFCHYVETMLCKLLFTLWV